MDNAPVGEAENMIEAIVGAIWHLERWDDVSDRLFSAHLTLIWAAPSHPAREDIKFLSEIAAARRMPA